MELTAEHARELFDYDPETGVLRWGTRRANRLQLGAPAGTQNGNGYTRVTITLGGKARRFYAHRLVWLLVHGEWPRGEIDHVNGDRQDNRLANLRDVPQQVNSENRRSRGTTYFPWGKRTRRWKAQIKARGSTISLGYYRTEEEAHTAYLEAKRKLHEGCTI